jgi:hypothetical protein
MNDISGQLGALARTVSDDFRRHAPDNAKALVSRARRGRVVWSTAVGSAALASGVVIAVGGAAVANNGLQSDVLPATPTTETKPSLKSAPMPEAHGVKYLQAASIEAQHLQEEKNKAAAEAKALAKKKAEAEKKAAAEAKAEAAKKAEKAKDHKKSGKHHWDSKKGYKSGADCGDKGSWDKGSWDKDDDKDKGSEEPVVEPSAPTDASGTGG